MSVECELLKGLINPLVTLVAAFAGAWAAFQFEKRHKKEEEKRRNISSANQALYTIYNMWNILFDYDKEVITPYKGKHNSWLNMAATLPSSNGMSGFSYEDLNFVLQSGSPNIYSNLLLEEQRFNSAINLIQARSSIVLSQVFPRLSAIGLKPGEGMDEGSMEIIIGIDNVHKLKEFTDGIIKNIEQDLESLKSIHDDLRNLMKEIYPKEKFILVKFNEAKTT